MRLDEELCYRAVQARDPRFDGRFFTAVRTTGVYCRPICPARTPQRRHVRFFPCAAAAEEAGYRPCRRCRPDAAPGSPAWTGTSATVTRGLRCIAEGALDEGGLDDLARRLGLGERHLRRLFLQHLGASPGRLARTRRVHFARHLIDQTDLPMVEVAFASGFASLRQFNALVKATFGDTPTGLRARALAGKTVRSDPSSARPNDQSPARPIGAGLTLRLPFRPPYDWEALAAFLSPRAIPGVERMERDRYARNLAVFRKPGATPDPEEAMETRRIELWPASGSSHLLLRIEPPLTSGLIELVERVKDLFDLAADPLPIREHFRKDPLLGPLLRARPGLRVPGAFDGFELAVRAILGQQVTVAGASTLAGRIAHAWGTPLSGGDDGPACLFPSASRLAEADLARVGLPAARAQAIRALAREVAAGRIALTPAAPLAETRERLLALPGVGAWTVEYIAMRALRDPDAFPSGDLGLRRAACRDGAPLSPKALSRLAEPWRPWRAYAAMHLWASLAPASHQRRRSPRRSPGRMEVS